jgi:hypothetical protein
LFILIQYFDGGNMSIDTNSMVSVLKNIVLDTKKINHEQIQQQDAINYIIQDVKVAIKDLLTEVDKIQAKMDKISNRS